MDQSELAIQHTVIIIYRRTYRLIPYLGVNNAANELEWLENLFKTQFLWMFSMELDCLIIESSIFIVTYFFVMYFSTKIAPVYNIVFPTILCKDFFLFIIANICYPLYLWHLYTTFFTDLLIPMELWEGRVRI